MKNYRIEACAGCIVWELDVNCPIGWRGSGCYDVAHECYQEGAFAVCANSLEDALKLVSKEWERVNHYDLQICGYYYDPSTVEIEDAEEDDGVAEVYEWYVGEPVEADVPERYKEEF